MKSVMKTLIVCVVVASVMVMSGTAAVAQVGFGFPPLWSSPTFSTQPMQVPTWEDPFLGEGDILIDNFEYWDSPYNHGWRQSEPAYPTYGFGMGYATIFNTILDLQEGSRVLDVYRPASVFLIGTPYEKHMILHGLSSPPSAIDQDGENFINLNKNPVLSFQFRAPLGIEKWDIFELIVTGYTGASIPNNITVRFLPLQPNAGACLGPVNSTDGMYGYQAAVTGFQNSSGTTAGSIEVTVFLGRGLLDGSWHVVWIDLREAVKAGVDVFSDIGTSERSDWYMVQADAILITGQMFRLDNLMFRADEGHDLLDYPDLFEMGPLYAQIFEPYRFLFFADYAGAHIATHDVDEHKTESDHISDLMLNPANFILTEDPNDPNDTVVKYWTDLGADPNLFGKNDPTIAALFKREQFVVDLSLPIFADPNMRFGGNTAKALIAQGTLGWNPTVGGHGANGVQAFLLQPLPVYPYDGMPTYFPSYYAAMDVIKAYGKPFYRPELVFILEGALWNAGMTVWPNIAALDYTPMYFEDLIVTIEVTNGVHSDVRTFPISVVNYPVENYPPVVQLEINDQIFYVGELGEYIVNFIDPDCFIFSMAQPAATTHTPGYPLSTNFRTDMEGLVWNMTINGLPNYQYGPWIEQIINPGSGLIGWTPKFEGAYNTVITCRDARSALGFGEITIFAVNRGTWLNHPPIILGGPTQPVVIKAGEEFILHAPNFSVEDPDGDQLYASCNIGSCGRAPDDSFIWTFQTNFPGSYMVEIVFYDIRGGYAIMELFLDVKPWWSY